MRVDIKVRRIWVSENKFKKQIRKKDRDEAKFLLNNRERTEARPIVEGHYEHEIVLI